MTEFFRAIDTETTGKSSTPPDVVCEVASVDLDWHPESKVGQPLSARSTLVQIGIPMPPDAQGVHHISDAELEAKGKSFQVAFKEVISPYPFPEKIVLVAHNASYEFGEVRRDASGTLLKDEIPAAVPIICTLKVAYRLWPDAPNHKLQTLRYFLKLQVPEKWAGGLPHRALPDAVVNIYLLIECLKLATAEQMIAWSKEPKLLPTCPIGKKQGWAGKPWSEVDAGFLRWMVNDADDMEADLKWLAKTELDRREHSMHGEGRTRYMALVPGVLKVATSLFDLRQWFKDETATRISLGIKEGTPEYLEIVRLCKEHGATLPQPAAPDKPVAPEPSAEPVARTPADAGGDDVPDDASDPAERQDDAA